MKAWIFIFELKNGVFKGVTAANEEEARELTTLKGWDVKRLARVEETYFFTAAGND